MQLYRKIRQAPTPHVIASQSADWRGNPYPSLRGNSPSGNPLLSAGALGRRKYLVMPPAGSFSSRGPQGSAAGGGVKRPPRLGRHLVLHKRSAGQNLSANPEKGTKRRFFHVRTAQRRCRGRSCHPENAAPPLVCTRFGASARRDDMRASPGSCTPGDASSVPAVVVGSLSGGIYAAPTECILAG